MRIDHVRTFLATMPPTTGPAATAQADARALAFAPSPRSATESPLDRAHRLPLSPRQWW